MKMDSKSYTAGYNQAIIDNKKKVAELKKDIKEEVIGLSPYGYGRLNKMIEKRLGK